MKGYFTNTRVLFMVWQVEMQGAVKALQVSTR